MAVATLAQRQRQQYQHDAQRQHLDQGGDEDRVTPLEQRRHADRRAAQQFELGAPAKDIEEVGPVVGRRPDVEFVTGDEVGPPGAG